jgi:DNA-binding Lrp family transcriptional regulator
MMAAKAYVLLRTAPGMTKAIYAALRVSPAVESVEMITGPYDLIVALEGESANELLTTVMREIRPAAGVRDTMTCMVIPTEEQASL